MPLYEYFCPPCNSQFEVLRPVSKMDDPAVCPSGHTTNNRVLSVFAPLARSGGDVATLTAQGGDDACCQTTGGTPHFGCSCC